MHRKTKACIHLHPKQDKATHLSVHASKCSEIIMIHTHTEQVVSDSVCNGDSAGNLPGSTDVFGKKKKNREK